MVREVTLQHNITQHNTTQHNTTQHNTTQHNTTQHNTIQHDINTTHHFNMQSIGPELDRQWPCSPIEGLSHAKDLCRAVTSHLAMLQIFLIYHRYFTWYRVRHVFIMCISYSRRRFAVMGDNRAASGILGHSSISRVCSNKQKLPFVQRVQKHGIQHAGQH